jgi:hypothetical protein
VVCLEKIFYLWQKIAIAIATIMSEMLKQVWADYHQAVCYATSGVNCEGY